MADEKKTVRIGEAARLLGVTPGKLLTLERQNILTVDREKVDRTGLTDDQFLSKLERSPRIYSEDDLKKARNHFDLKRRDQLVRSFGETVGLCFCCKTEEGAPFWQNGIAVELTWFYNDHNPDNKTRGNALLLCQRCFSFASTQSARLKSKQESCEQIDLLRKSS